MQWGVCKKAVGAALPRPAFTDGTEVAAEPILQGLPCGSRRRPLRPQPIKVENHVLKIADQQFGHTFAYQLKSVLTR